MKTTLMIVLCIGGSLIASGEEAPTALKSLKTLPRGAANQLAIIDGHDGTPTPERWHFLIADPEAENGFREFVVADGEVVADREVSQFAARITPEDVVGNAAVKIDSDAVARLVERYAAANGIPVASMNFRLRKDDLTPTPVWTVACRDAEGKAVASLVVDSRNGKVLAHEGFAVAPSKINPRLVTNQPDDEDRIPVRRAERVRRDRPSLPDPVREVRRLIHRLLPF